MLLKIVLVMCMFLCYDVRSQICTKKEVLTRWVQEKYQYSYRATYMDKCFFGRRCKKTRTQWAENIRSVPTQVVESTQVCCSGYRSLDIYTSSGDIACSPICSPACKNGYCSAPGVCQCDLGFVVDPASPHSCLPMCGDCGHGKCVAPNVCECNFGYSLQNGTCHAICTNPCLNGTCVAPDTCECLPGYRKSVSNICTPYCTQGCWHGTCTAPETCVCDKGWHKTPTNECVPLCENECGNGTCTAPNVCECAAGYKIDETKVPVCVPHCEIDCGFGNCTAPNVCECATGYMIDETNVPKCVPRCDIECGNGTCVAPNVCDCAAGYQIDGTNVPMCVPQCNIECGNGACVAPNVCDCAAGYQIDGTNVPMCVPRCDIQCGNGACVAPNVCECAAGYQIDGTNVFMCVPVCETECGNGTCNAPNICECVEGYKADKTKVPVCRPYCALCDGICIAPGQCECEEPFKAKFVTADGQNCDGTTHKCERTICTRETRVQTKEENISYGNDDFLITIKVRNITKNELEDDPNSSEHNDYEVKQTANATNETDAITIETTMQTNEENISYGNDDFLITIKARNVTKTEFEDDPDSLEYNDYEVKQTLNDTIDIDAITEPERWIQSKWAYAVISVVAIIIAIILGSIAIYWKSLSRCCEGGSYEIDDKAKDTSNQESNSTMRLSSLLKGKEAERN